MSFDSDLLVSVCVITFNHEKYIAQCLNSILNQVVDFKYEIIVGDDCSRDSTQDILRKYKEEHPGLITLLLNESNEGISLNYRNVLSRCKGKYIALCEGDDFWTDPIKLKEQVHFLETHDKYGFVGAYSTLLFPDGHYEEDPYEYFPNPQREGEWELYGDVFNYAKYGPVTRTVSLCFRKALIEPYNGVIGLGNDLILQSVLAKSSLFAKHSRVMTVYRQGGISTDRFNWEKQLYYNKWNVSNRLLQMDLFPEDCKWDRSALLDREKYILLKKSIMELDWREALKNKRGITSSKYTNKYYFKLLHGPLSCFLLSIKLRLSK